jgi:heat shock protein HslJ
MTNSLRRRGAALALVILIAASLAACVPMAPVVQPAQQPVQAPAQTAPEAARTVTMIVGPELVDCTGVAPQKCYQVKAQPGDEWRMFYSPIQGFEYEPGYEYQITVKVESVANPPADASAYSYTLVEVISKTPASQTGAEPAATAAPAAATPENKPAASLEGAPWKLVSYADSEGKIQKPLAGTEITIEFRGGNVAGNSGCNNYMGTYEASGETLSIRLSGATMMACPEPVMSQESAYWTALESAGLYRIAGDELQIVTADGKPLLSYVLLQPAALSGTNWLVTSYNNGKQALVSPLAGSAITLLFGADGVASGSTGCNNYSAPYTVEGATLAVGPAAATRMMCAEPAGIMEQEAAYLAALTGAAAFTIQGDELNLLDAAGTRMVQARAVQGQAAQGQPAQGQPTQGQPEQAQPAQGQAVADEWTAVLENLTYQSYITESGMAPLENGEYREPAAPDSAEEIVVLLTDSVATGDLNGDGIPDAAVVLATNSGGSGVFIDLAVVVVEDGQPVNVAITPLGDRVQINSLTIQDGQIVVDMVVQGPDDPMCCPTQQVVETYELQGYELVQM